MADARTHARTHARISIKNAIFTLFYCTKNNKLSNLISGFRREECEIFWDMTPCLLVPSYFLVHEYWTSSLSRNFGKELPTDVA